ncbi:Metallo-dependent phosphatase [Annulohypoxylon maeteangense]|uniref:Metallo-dependent phosphatase n=1 Tax=Annulohypoxylon maeteangense TaxID=1927788 RepID=UPI0020087FF6|nr:Metallo-dependent phosphatase [Annulohypoxylon maeteangense]KAI0884310.1 Metallo-dependent phosphatase [Annulohypoxylon maeteangense]
MIPLILAVMASVIPMLEARPFAKKITNSTKAGFGPLTFKSDGTFQIAVFEDLHFGENAWDQWGPQQDINSVQVINKILDAESPGLVVLNGDLITGENTFLENSTVYVDQIVGPLVNRGLTWASTYGNHDYDFNISGNSILAREKLWPNSRTQQMVISKNSGVSNYYLPVYDSKCSTDDCAPELLLWFFDSKGGFKYQQKNASGSRVGNPDWVDSSVVDWFVDTNTQLVSKFNKTIPSLAFVHIPTYASYVLQQQGVNPHTEPGINDDNPLAPQAQGWCSDGRNDGTCTYGGQDIPFMEAISTVPGLIGVFSGHDHGDSWCNKWDKQLPNMSVVPKNDVILCFSQHSGYGGYGNWERGSRQLLVSKSKLQEGAVDTWIRLESGNIAGSVTLNSTFGQDHYPATNNTKTYCPTCDYTST